MMIERNIDNENTETRLVWTGGVLEVWQKFPKLNNQWEKIFLTAEQAKELRDFLVANVVD